MVSYNCFEKVPAASSAAFAKYFTFSNKTQIEKRDLEPSEMLSRKKTQNDSQSIPKINANLRVDKTGQCR